MNKKLLVFDCSLQSLASLIWLVSSVDVKEEIEVLVVDVGTPDIVANTSIICNMYDIKFYVVAMPRELSRRNDPFLDEKYEELINSSAFIFAKSKNYPILYIGSYGINLKYSHIHQIDCISFIRYKDIINYLLSSEHCKWDSVSYTISCVHKTEHPCGKCLNCVNRQHDFNSIGIQDPLLVRLLR